MATTRDEVRPAKERPGPATVRDAALEVLRRRSLTTIFANPGSTEIALLGDFPDDLEFVLGLHENSVVGIASGYALARRRPSLVLLHTTAGLGNAVNAIATARLNRTPLVIVVGQQDRRHLAFEPFLAGRLEGLAGSYPVWFHQPVRAQDLPAAIDRAYHEAMTRRGPAIVVAPQSDWLEPAGEEREDPSAGELLSATVADEQAVARLAWLVESAERPALVAGAGVATEEAWDALVALAERLGCSVWQEAYSGGAGFPQDHPQYAGRLPSSRPQLRDTLAAHDLVLVAGAPIFRQTGGYQPGPLVVEGTTLALVTDDPEEAHRSPAELALLGPIASICRSLAAQLSQRERPNRALFERPPPPPPAEPLRGAHVVAALAERLPADAVVVEECPSDKPELELRVQARAPLGFVSAAGGGLGWGLNAAIGLRLGLPERPVVAVLGDGSTIFGVQGLWNAAHYEVGVLFVVLVNGGYRVMDLFTRAVGAEPVWPAFAEVDMTTIARGFACEARRIEQHSELLAAFDETIPSLRTRRDPLLLEVAIAGP